jgi:hypothetical protein
MLSWLDTTIVDTSNFRMWCDRCAAGNVGQWTETKIDPARHGVGTKFDSGVSDYSLAVSGSMSRSLTVEQCLDPLSRALCHLGEKGDQHPESQDADDDADDDHNSAQLSELLLLLWVRDLMFEEGMLEGSAGSDPFRSVVLRNQMILPVSPPKNCSVRGGDTQ